MGVYFFNSWPKMEKQYRQSPVDYAFPLDYHSSVSKNLPARRAQIKARQHKQKWPPPRPRSPPRNTAFLPPARNNRLPRSTRPPHVFLIRKGSLWRSVAARRRRCCRRRTRLRGASFWVVFSCFLRFGFSPQIAFCGLIYLRKNNVRPCAQQPSLEEPAVNLVDSSS